MIGPYYKPQLTSMMSIAHRATGVFLSLVGAPLLLWWLLAVSSGPEAYAGLAAFAGSAFGMLLLAVSLFCLNYHLLNGIRHLVWDSVRAFDLRSVYTGGWLVLAGSVVLTAIVLGVAL